MTLRTLSAVLLVSACATEPPAPSAPAGTAERDQQSYMEALQKCQDAHRWDKPADAGIGAAATKDDAAFSECLKQAKADLSKSQGGDAGPH
jgi:outer membrane PBP1 activator LpoA protein